MKSQALSVLLALLGCVQGVRVIKTRHSCNNVLEDKIVSFEYNYFSGNQLEPGLKSKHGYTMWLPNTGRSNLTVSNGAAWRTEKCGTSLCIVSMKTEWEHYYLYMKTFGGTKHRMYPNLGYFEDVHEADPPWTVQFDIKCEDCNKRNHCYVINRYHGNSKQKNFGRLFADSNGYSVFGYLYGQSYEDWFDWSVHLHNSQPMGGQASLHLGIHAAIVVVMFNWK